MNSNNLIGARPKDSLSEIPGLQLPEIESDAFNPEELEARAERVRKEVERTSDWVKKALTALKKIKGLSREARESKEVQTTADTLNQLLWKESTKAYRRAAWLTLFQWFFTQEVEGREWRVILQEMFSEGYLKEDPEARFSIGDVRFNLPVEAPFEDGDVGKLRQLVEIFSKRIQRARKKEVWEKARSLLSQSELSLPQFLDLNAKDGRFALEVPVRDDSSVPGASASLRLDGTVLCQKRQGKVYILDVTGNDFFVTRIRAVHDMGLFLKVSALNREHPPGRKTLTDAGLSEEETRTLRGLWFALARGIKHLRAKEVILKEKKEMADKATLSPGEFFLELNQGICLVEYPGVWRLPDNGTISNLFFLVERREDKIILLEAPLHLRDFLGHLVGTKFKDIVAFKEAPQSLQAVLRAVYGLVRKDRAIEE